MTGQATSMTVTSQCQQYAKICKNYTDVVTRLPIGSYSLVVNYMLAGIVELC